MPRNVLIADATAQAARKIIGPMCRRKAGGCVVAVAQTDFPAAPQDLPSNFEFCVQENGMFLRARDINHPYHGADVASKGAKCFTDPKSGMRLCTFKLVDEVFTLPACIDPSVEKEPMMPNSCLHPETSSITSPGSSYDGLEVDVDYDSIKEVAGVPLVAVHHEKLPGGIVYLPMCEEVDSPGFYRGFSRSPDRPRRGSMSSNQPKARRPSYRPRPVICCYSIDEGVLVCQGSKYDGLAVKVVAQATLPDGRQFVHVVHPSLPDGMLKAPTCHTEKEHPDWEGCRVEINPHDSIGTKTRKFNTEGCPPCKDSEVQHSRGPELTMKNTRVKTRGVYGDGTKDELFLANTRCVPCKLRG